MINLMQGDCLEIMKEIPDGSVDMVLTDPPYGITACKWDSVIPFAPMWEQLKRVTKRNAAIVMTASQPFTTSLIASNMEMFRYCWVWEKNKATGHLNAKKQPLKSYEDVVVFYQNQSIYNPQYGTGEAYSNNNTAVDEGGCYGETKGSSVSNVTTRYPRRNISIDVDIKARHHPTQKPIALMEYMIRTYTNEDETVLDFTMGSGTTGVAAKSLDRSFIGIELDEGYFKIAQDRIAQERQRGLF